MEALSPLIIQLISGAAGGNIVGKLFSNLITQHWVWTFCLAS